MTKLYTYVITKDTGLAPNPFHGWCSLAVCSPNRQGAKLESGDWVAGFLDKSRGYRLVYAMQVDERINLNDYYHDPRFKAKKPDLRGDWIARCGDNFYSQDEDGKWKQHRNRFHIGSKYLEKDTRRPVAFLGRRFWYFGREAPEVPSHIASLAGGRGIRCNHEQKVVRKFVNWVSSGWKEGIHGSPNDNPDIDASQCARADTN